MKCRIKLAFYELKKKPFFSFLLIVVVTIAMQTMVSAFTNALTVTYQKMIFENNLDYDMGNVLHIKYQYTSETPEFAYALSDFMEYIKSLDGVKTVGRYNMTSVYFTEIKNEPYCQSIIQELFKHTDYADYTSLSHIIRIDEDILSMVKGEIDNFPQTVSGAIPIYASAVYKDILFVGMLLNMEVGVEQTEIYEIVGFLPDDFLWLSGDDLIRYPMISVNGWFITPFTETDNNDIMTQLSCLHNTYVSVLDKEKITSIAESIRSYSVAHNFKATAITLEEEYVAYERETARSTTNNIFLAAFVTLMTSSSIIAVFTTNTLLKKKQYGILLANGFTLNDIAVSIVFEIFIITFVSALVAWLMKFNELWRSTDLFRAIMLEAHLRYTPLYMVLASIILTIIASAIPTKKIRKYKPCELIGGTSHGNDRA